MIRTRVVRWNERRYTEMLRELKTQTEQLTKCQRREHALIKNKDGAKELPYPDAPRPQSSERRQSLPALWDDRTRPFGDLLLKCGLSLTKSHSLVLYRHHRVVNIIFGMMKRARRNPMKEVNLQAAANKWAARIGRAAPEIPEVAPVIRADITLDGTNGG